MSFATAESFFEAYLLVTWLAPMLLVVAFTYIPE
jgi:hypothetical protein